MSYFALNQQQAGESPYAAEGPIHFSNSIPGASPDKTLMQETVYEGSSPSDFSDPVQGKPPTQRQKTWSIVTTLPWRQSTNRRKLPFSLEPTLASAANSPLSEPGSTSSTRNTSEVCQPIQKLPATLTDLDKHAEYSSTACAPGL